MKSSLFAFITCFCSLFAISCGNGSVPCVTRIIDMSSEETMSIDLSYDGRGRLVKLGGATIDYGHNKISIENPGKLLGYDHFYAIEFTLHNGRVVGSLSHCFEKIAGKIVEVSKKTTYTYADNRIVVESESSDYKSNRVLKKNREVRELGEGDKLVKVTYTDSDGGDEVALYKYDSNLTCKANLNLQAFSYSLNGLDDLLVYLLNLNKLQSVNILPDEINFDFSNGVKHMYNENCCLDNDRLTRLEVVLNYERLIARLNFEYQN